MSNHNICRELFPVPEYLVVDVEVPVVADEKIHGGSVLLAEKLVAETDNKCRYEGELTDVVTKEPVILLPCPYDTLDDGRRPDGNPNVATYTYRAGDVAGAIRLAKGMTFEIGYDAVDTTVTPVENGYLIPVATKATMAVTTTEADVTASAIALKIEKLHGVGIGGQFGMGVAPTMIVRVIKA